MDGDLSYRSLLIEVRRTADRGRGVFATDFIPHGALIERAPVIVVPAEEVLRDRATTLMRYVFDWREAAGRDAVAVGLGLASIYNHDWPANADWRASGEDFIEIVAHRDIPADREITINYRGDPDDPEPIDFG